MHMHGVGPSDGIKREPAAVDRGGNEREEVKNKKNMYKLIGLHDRTLGVVTGDVMKPNMG